MVSHSPRPEPESPPPNDYGDLLIPYSPRFGQVSPWHSPTSPSGNPEDALAPESPGSVADSPWCTRGSIPYSPISPHFSSPRYSPESPTSPRERRRSSTPSVAALKEYYEKEKPPVEELPKLPDPRPRALTPPGFREDDSRGPPHALFQESAAYFKLPPNIRSDIIQLVFRERRLHMHLSYDHPDASHRPDPLSHCHIANRHSRIFLQKKNRLVHTTEPKAWRWWGSACHRIAPDASDGPMTRDGPVGPWVDDCREGGAAHCPRKGDAVYASACRIGIMGWLLSCRQNYAEGITALYAKNTIIMRGKHLIMHLPQLILPHRLASMTSVELVWPIKRFRLEGHRTMGMLDEAHLQDFLEVISTQLTGLRRLYVSLECPSKYQSWLRNDHSWSAIRSLPEEREEIVLIEKHLDSFVKRMSALRECAFAFPEWLFELIYSDAAGQLNPDGTRARALQSYRQVWRGSDGKLSIVRLPFVDSYPGPPYQLKQPATPLDGYWILEGTTRPPPYEPLLPTGTISTGDGIILTYDYDLH
ncbi:DNA-directed RNA polymerase II subunit RPB1 [Paramyrothecium foliicola]|nr:DNA-directed RNA polymerase II subunit RPB1 [Paramyrothecium foliicola]